MAELGTVTVLFCDLVGSTAMAARIGDSAADEVRRTCFTAWRGAVGQTGGREVKTQGDGMMVVFTSIVSALDCAVAMQRATLSVVPEGGPALKVGISTGEAALEDGDYHGTPVVEASRLCDACAPGQILANAFVRALAGSRSTHRFTPVGELELKGLDPLDAVEVGWEPSPSDAVPFPPMLAQARRLPLVGRREHRAKLEAAFDRAAKRRVVLLAGEPGVGKTRLAAEFCSWAHGRGAIVLAGRCDEGIGFPYQPWVQSLDHLAVSMKTEDFEAAAGDGLRRLSKLLPSLGDRDDEVDDEDRFLLFEAVDTLLSAVSDRAPIVLVLDDVHWADRSSLQLLRHVSGSARAGRLFVVATYRDTDVDRRHPLSHLLADITRQGTVERMQVGGLDRGEVGELIASRAGADAPGELVDAIAQKTEGNAFFAGEVLEHLTATGAIAYEDGRWTATRSLDDLGLPEGIRDVVGRRLSQLSESANTFLGVAAVAGPEFDLDVVAEAGSIDRAQALSDADEALQSILVVEVEGRVGRYAFTHALVRQTLIEELSTTRRVHLHWGIGEALQARGADADAVAFHMFEGVLAGDTERAVRASLAAGSAAIERFATDEALVHHERALSILDQRGWPDDELRTDVLIALGASLLEARDRARAAPPLQQAAAIARQLGDTDRLVQAALAPGVAGAIGWGRSAEEAALARPFAELLQEALDATEGLDSPERALLLVADAARGGWTAANQDAFEMARRTGDWLTIWTVGSASANVFLDVADAGARADFVAEMRRAAQEISGTQPGRIHQLIGARSPRTTIAMWEFTEAVRSGDVEAADRCWAEVRRLAPPDRYRWVEPAMAVASGDFDAALEHMRAADDEGLTQDPLFATAMENYRSLVLLYTGRLREVADGSRELLEQRVIPREWWSRVAVCEAMLGDFDAARAAVDAMGPNPLESRAFFAPTLAALAEAAVLLGDADLARTVLAAAGPWAGQHPSGGGVVVDQSADTSIAHTLAALGRHDEAAASYESGIALEDRMRFRAIATRSRCFYAECLLALGRTDDARAMRDRCIVDAAELGMAAIEQRARTLAMRS